MQHRSKRTVVVKNHRKTSNGSIESYQKLRKLRKNRVRNIRAIQSAVRTIIKHKEKISKIEILLKFSTNFILFFSDKTREKSKMSVIIS